MPSSALVGRVENAKGKIEDFVGQACPPKLRTEAGSTTDGKDAPRDNPTPPNARPGRAPVLSILWWLGANVVIDFYTPGS